MTPRPTKTCAACGRTIAWRKKWARDWGAVRYCSAACRRRKLRPVDHALETAILELLQAKPRGATIAPADAIAAVDAGEGASLDEPARRAARRLVARGRLEILQDGRVVDPSTAAGALRLRLTTS